MTFKSLIYFKSILLMFPNNTLNISMLSWLLFHCSVYMMQLFFLLKDQEFEVSLEDTVKTVSKKKKMNKWVTEWINEWRYLPSSGSVPILLATGKQSGGLGPQVLEKPVYKAIFQPYLLLFIALWPIWLNIKMVLFRNANPMMWS